VTVQSKNEDDGGRRGNMNWSNLFRRIREAIARGRLTDANSVRKVGLLEKFSTEGVLARCTVCGYQYVEFRQEEENIKTTIERVNALMAENHSCGQARDMGPGPKEGKTGLGLVEPD
jgi:hypothetical protein